MQPSVLPTPDRPGPLSLQPLALAGGTHGVLLFHGLSSGPLELQFVARGLHRAGYSVRACVIANYTYGLTSGENNNAAAWERAALAEFDAFAAQFDTVSVGGLCIGAVLALRVAALRSSRIRSVLALSTTLHFDGWANPWYTPLLQLGRVLPFTQRMAIREGEPYGLKDTRMRGWVKRQMQASGNSNAGAACLRVGDLLKASDLIRRTAASLSQVTSATLLIHAREDDCASPRSAFEVASRINAAHIQVILLSNSYHMISIDQEKDKVITHLTRFLAALLEPQKAHNDLRVS
ncbi:MAG: alpha/beta fold hydrolase [Polaromonas sp.]|nr:alpha/beta fold hydrolase [Polaromonas sp.]